MSNKTFLSILIALSILLFFFIGYIPYYISYHTEISNSDYKSLTFYDKDSLAQIDIKDMLKDGKITKRELYTFYNSRILQREARDTSAKNDLLKSLSRR